MTDLAQLLPPNASELERNLVRIAPRSDLDMAADAPANIASTMPAAFQPWLAAEWNLAQFSLYFASDIELIAAGLPWLLERGSAASVVRALSWLGYDQITIEEDEFLIHIDPATTAAALDLARLRQVVNASLPAHSRFYRLYHGLDLRAGRFDATNFDQCLFDDDSGIWEGDPASDGVKLSFRETHTAAVNAPPELAPIAAHRPRQFNTIVDDSLMQLDSWVLDSEIRLNSVVSISDLSTGFVNQPALLPALGNHHATACTVLPAQAAPLPMTAIAPGTAASVTSPALPVYGWSDQWASGWAVCYPLISNP
ncbi:phage tail protein [Undibacterium sp. SXout7W]|uniref:phage tail protein n=1 Tax=Undibacterium sp. SXout7W TaxID=3413049 RepID=UPI003BF276FE